MVAKMTMTGFIEFEPIMIGAMTGRKLVPKWRTAEIFIRKPISKSMDHTFYLDSILNRDVARWVEGSNLINATASVAVHWDAFER